RRASDCNPIIIRIFTSFWTSFTSSAVPPVPRSAFCFDYCSSASASINRSIATNCEFWRPAPHFPWTGSEAKEAFSIFGTFLDPTERGHVQDSRANVQKKTGEEQYFQALRFPLVKCRHVW